MKKLILLALTTFSTYVFAGPNLIYCPEKIVCDPQGTQFSCHMVGGTQNYFELKQKIIRRYFKPYELTDVSTNYNNDFDPIPTTCNYHFTEGTWSGQIEVVARTLLEASIKDSPKWRIGNEFAGCSSTNPSDCPLKLWNPNKKV